MTRRNPYKTAETIGNIIGYTIVGAFVLAAVALVVTGLAVEQGWGWWTLLLIPGVPVAIIVIGLIVGLLHAGGERIERAWRSAKWRWDRENADTTGENV